MNSRLSIICLLAIGIIITGCSNSSSTYNEVDITKPFKQEDASILDSTESLKERSLEAYNKFIGNEEVIYFSDSMPKDRSEANLFEKEKGYKLSEVLDRITTCYFEYTSKKRIGHMDYSYIDCGMDGVNELILRFNDMEIYGENDNSTLVYIVKYIDGKLNLTYYYKTWARCETAINEYGYYKSGGSGGASNHTAETGLIDTNGSLRFIASIESELDITVFSEVYKLAEMNNLSTNIQIDKINLDRGSDREPMYSFYIYNDEWELVEDKRLYDDSRYKEIMNEVLISVIAPDELAKLIDKKEEMVGVNSEIKDGAEITWRTIENEIFNKYVGRDG